MLVVRNKEDIKRIDIKTGSVIMIDGSISDVLYCMNSCRANNTRLIYIRSLMDSDKDIIFSTLVSNKIYDIYEVAYEDIDEEYIKNIGESNNTLEDVKQFISDNLDRYDNMIERLDNIKQAIINRDINEDVIDTSISDIDCAIEYIKILHINSNNGLAEGENEDTEVKKKNEESLNVIASNETENVTLDKKDGNQDDIIQTMEKIEALSRQIVELKDKKENLELNTNTLNSEIRNKDNEIYQLNSELVKKTEQIEQLNLRICKSNDEVEDIKARLNKSAIVINMYNTIKVQAVNNCKTKNVVYVKEISYVRYVNTLMTQIIQLYTKRKFKCKLVIFDEREINIPVYEPVLIVNANTYNQMKAKVELSDTVVIASPHTYILEDILKCEYDLVIVYDRMYKNTPIVSGNNVSTLYVINSLTEFNNLTHLQIDTEKVITRDKSIMGAIGIPELKAKSGEHYREQTPTSKLSSYLQMIDSETNRKTIERIVSEPSLSAMGTRG